jgi:pimeloyl-ACP methyl ester carboxylesterase
MAVPDGVVSGDVRATSSTSTSATTDEVVPFVTADGRAGNVVHVVGDKAPVRGPVILVHGAGVRANIFRAPVDVNLVDDLVANGFDVWLENWRASTDLPPTEWTLDDAALYDHPAAVRTVLDRTGAPSCQAVIHCQGSTSFMMSAVAGLLPEVDTIVSNAVSLHPVVPSFARWKITSLTKIMSRLTRYLDPQWGIRADGAVPKAIVGAVELSHHECDNTVCKMVSFTYGAGHPALWSHANLNDDTHEWLKGEFKKVPLSFFLQMEECIKAGHLVSVRGHPELPLDYIAQAPATDARMALFAGSDNLCFLPVSQERTFAWFDGHARGAHSLHVLPRYGHLDVFMGRRAATDVFPLIRSELGQTS